MTRVICAMIVGPGEGHRYLDRTLRCATGWADDMVIYADGVDEDTAHALDRCRPNGFRRVRRGAPNPAGFHESTARNELLGMLDVHAHADDVVVMLDADEELRGLDGSPANVHGILRTLANSADPGPWAQQFWHLWAPDGTVHRVDGMWQPSVGVRIYRHRPGLRHADQALAVPAIPPPAGAGAGQPVLALAHWGYARLEDRMAKHAFYLEHDGGRYHHIGHLQSIATQPTLEVVPSCRN